MSIPLTYYFDWQGLEDFSGYAFDARGIPLVDYGPGIGVRANAITVSQFGLDQLRIWSRSKDEKAKQRALRCGRWLVDNAEEWRLGIKAWVYDFEFPFYGPRAPWISAMAQGEAISLLLRCHMIQSNSEFLIIARQAIPTFFHTVDEGGVCDYIDGHALFLQEYPTSPGSFVLNGHIFSLIGVYDYSRYTGDKRCEKIVEQSLDTLELCWRKWDVGYWTRYDLYPVTRLSSRMYHRLHCRQMRMLAAVAGRSAFTRVADRWEHMLVNPRCNFRWLIAKGLEKLSSGKRR